MNITKAVEILNLDIPHYVKDGPCSEFASGAHLLPLNFNLVLYGSSVVQVVLLELS
jgi:hypothetical protein